MEKTGLKELQYVKRLPLDDLLNPARILEGYLRKGVYWQFRAAAGGVMVTTHALNSSAFLSIGDRVLRPHLLMATFNMSQNSSNLKLVSLT